MVSLPVRVQVEAWCFRALGPGTLTSLHPDAGGQMSQLFRFDSESSGPLALKVRPGAAGRIRRCQQLQSAVAASGFPCPRPASGLGVLDSGLVVSAETWLPGGEMNAEPNAAYASRSAALLADLMMLLERETSIGLSPPPPWMHWNPPTGDLWPRNPVVDSMDQSRVPEQVTFTARAVAKRLAIAPLPVVIGHGDWESQNLRWKADRPWAVHDWDSLVALPAAAIVGAASGAFGSTATPTLASVEASQQFIEAYEHARGIEFSIEEREVAWAASLWPALHNARGESLFESPPTAVRALSEQSRHRLERAGVR
ncbi:phosphotransferase [Arthrobacter sp. NPDC080082]|uniref:phosphotransferase n=1 Tax=unclassified Arthrobacter TaxID=235627 RepID=UPI00342D99AD